MAIHGYQGGVVSATSPTVSSSAASGLWTKWWQLYYQASGNWPQAPFLVVDYLVVAGGGGGGIAGRLVKRRRSSAITVCTPSTC